MEGAQPQVQGQVKVDDFRDAIFTEGRIIGRPFEGEVACEVTVDFRDDGFKFFVFLELLNRGQG